MIIDAKSKVFVVMNQQTEWDFRASMYKHKGGLDEKCCSIFVTETFLFRKSGKQIIFGKTSLTEKTVLDK